MQRFKQKLWTQVGITVLLIAALVFGLLYVSSKLNRSVAEIQKLRQELVYRWSSLSQLANLLTAYNVRAEKGLVALERVIPKRDTLLNLGRDLRGLAVRSNVEQTYSFISETAAQGGVLGYISFNLMVTGSYDNLRSYVQSLDSFIYLSRFDAIELQNLGVKSTATIRGRVFFE